MKTTNKDKVKRSSAEPRDRKSTNDRKLMQGVDVIRGDITTGRQTSKVEYGTADKYNGSPIFIPQKKSEKNDSEQSSASSGKQPAFLRQNSAEERQKMENAMALKEIVETSSVFQKKASERSPAGSAEEVSKSRESVRSVKDQSPTESVHSTVGELIDFSEAKQLHSMGCKFITELKSGGTAKPPPPPEKREKRRRKKEKGDHGEQDRKDLVGPQDSDTPPKPPPRRSREKRDKHDKHDKHDRHEKHEKRDRDRHSASPESSGSSTSHSDQDHEISTSSGHKLIMMDSFDSVRSEPLLSPIAEDQENGASTESEKHSENEASLPPLPSKAFKKEIVTSGDIFTDANLAAKSNNVHDAKSGGDTDIPDGASSSVSKSVTDDKMRESTPGHDESKLSSQDDKDKVGGGDYVVVMTAPKTEKVKDSQPYEPVGLGTGSSGEKVFGAAKTEPSAVKSQTATQLFATKSASPSTTSSSTEQKSVSDPSSASDQKSSSSVPKSESSQAKFTSSDPKSSTSVPKDDPKPSVKHDSAPVTQAPSAPVRAPVSVPVTSSSAPDTATAPVSALVSSVSAPVSSVSAPVSAPVSSSGHKTSSAASNSASTSASSVTSSGIAPLTSSKPTGVTSASLALEKPGSPKLPPPPVAPKPSADKVAAAKTGCGGAMGCPKTSPTAGGRKPPEPPPRVSSVLSEGQVPQSGPPRGPLATGQSDRIVHAVPPRGVASVLGEAVSMSGSMSGSMSDLPPPPPELLSDIQSGLEMQIPAPIGRMAGISGLCPAHQPRYHVHQPRCPAHQAALQPLCPAHQGAAQQDPPPIPDVLSNTHHTPHGTPKHGPHHSAPQNIPQNIPHHPTPPSHVGRSLSQSPPPRDSVVIIPKSPPHTAHFSTPPLSRMEPGASGFGTDSARVPHPAITTANGSLVNRKAISGFQMEAAMEVADGGPKKQDVGPRPGVTGPPQVHGPTPVVPPRGKLNMTDPWQCKACTFANPGESMICKMCSKSRLPSPEASNLLSGGSQCPRCTYVNAVGSLMCKVCMQDLKDSPTYI